MKKSVKTAAGIFSLALIFVLLVTSIDFHAFNKNYYREHYIKLNTADSLGMSDEDLFAATETLLDYLHDQRDDILVSGEVFGMQREIFTERETLHMVDVKNLYKYAEAPAGRQLYSNFNLSADCCWNAGRVCADGFYRLLDRFPRIILYE